MTDQRLWIISVLISLFIVAAPIGIALTLTPLILFAIPLASSEIWQGPPDSQPQV